MRAIYRRCGAAVLFVTLIGASVGATRLPAEAPRPPAAVQPPEQAQAQSESSAASVRRPPPKVSAAVATFRGGSTYADGVRVEVTRIRRTELHKPLKARHVSKGAPVQVLSVRVTNGSRLPVTLAGTPRQVTYGPKHTLAPIVLSKRWRPMRGTIKPGGSLVGTFGFAVPKDDLNTTTLTFGFSRSHGPAVLRGSLEYSPTASTIFNDPTGSKARQFAIIRQIERSIAATPKGGTIRIAHYSFDVKSAAKALLAAHRRGVHVQMIVDQHENLVTSETQSLIDELGHNRHRKSFLVRCKASCMSNHTSAMHAKFYLFSAVGATPNVSMISSSNLTHTNSENSWNDLQTVVGDRVLYSSLKRYFRDMLPDKNRPNYFRTTSDGQYKLYFYPRSARHGGDKPSLMNVLNQVRCSGAAPGYGDQHHRTVVRVTMYSWTGQRVDIAQRLWRLHDAGCQVQVIYNSGRTSYPVTQALLRVSSRHGRLDLYDAWRDRNLNDQPELYVHQKALAINGVVNGRSTKVVYAGSQNYTDNATLDNNEIIFRNTDNATYNAYAANFKDMRRHAERQNLRRELERRRAFNAVPHPDPLISRRDPQQ